MNEERRHYEMDEMRPLSEDLRKYWNLIWHWAWLIALAAVLAAAAAFLVSRGMQPVYEAETTVLVDQGSTSTNEYQSILMSERLTQTYADLMVRRPVLDKVIDTLDLDLKAKDLGEKITIQPVRDTQLINVKVEDESSGQSAKIANALVEVFIEQNRERQTRRYAESKDNLQRQMERVDENIRDTNQALDELEENNGSAEERSRLETQLSQYQDTYASLLQSYEEIRRTEAETISTIVQVEPATPPLEPVRPRTLVNTALAGAVGGMLAVGGVFLMETLDDAVKDPDQVERMLDAPILGMIPKHAGGEQGVIAVEQPRHPVAEAFRVLRTNIKYTSVDHPMRKLLITSPGPGVGKTSVTANLAAVLAQGGSSVLLLDADLRRPKIHQRLGTGNHRGLADSFVDDGSALDEYLQKVEGEENLSLITSGAVPPNPAELLSSQKMARMLETLAQSYDYILLDSPPLMAVADAAIISQVVDGVLLVVKPGQTEVGALQSAAAQLRQVQARILGLVMNEIPRKGSRYYYQGYQYYSYQDYDQVED